MSEASGMSDAGEMAEFFDRWPETAAPGQPGQVPSGHPDAGKPVGWGEHPRDCDCGDCP